MRYLDFDLSFEKMTPKVWGSTTLGGQKIEKNFFGIFLLFFTELGGETSKLMQKHLFWPSLGEKP